MQKQNIRQLILYQWFTLAVRNLGDMEDQEKLFYTLSSYDSISLFFSLSRHLFGFSISKLANTLILHLHRVTFSTLDSGGLLILFEETHGGLFIWCSFFNLMTESVGNSVTLN